MGETGLREAGWCLQGAILFCKAQRLWILKQEFGVGKCPRGGVSWSLLHGQTLFHVQLSSPPRSQDKLLAAEQRTLPCISFVGLEALVRGWDTESYRVCPDRACKSGQHQACESSAVVV